MGCLAVTACLLVPFAPAQAGGGGSVLRFGQPTFAPGERAVGRAEHVQTWPGTGEPGEGPFTVYLVPGKGPLWYGHLPNNAVRVGTLHIGDDLGQATYSVTAEFDVPDLSDGPYAVWVCARECRLGFGDLVYGMLHVEATRPSTPQHTGTSLTPPTAGVLWQALVGIPTAILLAAAVLGVAIGWAHGRIYRDAEPPGDGGTQK